MLVKCLLCIGVLFSMTNAAILKDYRFLSHNVTALLDRLLDKNRYDKRIRPDLGGPPVTVQVNMYIKSIGPVSENDESYGMDCYFRQTWYDKRLAYSFLGFNEFSFPWLILDKVWKPDTYFMNGKKSHLHRITVPNKFLRLRNDGYLTYSMRLTIMAACPMHLRNFPLDSQRCPLYIGSYGYMTRDVMYEWASMNSVSIENQELAQYSLEEVTTVNHTTVMRGNDKHSMIHVNFNMKRMTGFFLLQVYVPCGLIVCCSWVSFWIDPDAVPARVSLGVTTVLSMTTMGFGGKAQMPKVSYATALDWFVILCFSFVFAVMIEYAAINFLDKVTKDLKRIIKEKGKANPSASPPEPQPETVTNPPTPCVSTLDLTQDPEASPADFADQVPKSPTPTTAAQNFLNAFKRSPLLDPGRVNRLSRRRTLSCISAEVNLNAPTSFVPLIIVTDKESSNSTSNGKEFDQNTIVDLENDHNYATVEDIGDCNDLDNISDPGSLEKTIPDGLCEIFNACVRIFGAPFTYWKQWRFLPNEEDVSKLLLSEDPPQKFTNIDIQARKIFPICFFFLLSVYCVAYCYFADQYPNTSMTQMRTHGVVPVV